MMSGQEYSVKLDFFEGPIDLLLYLIQRAEMNIMDISVAAISKQYLTYLDLMRELNINIASEYLSMAATLIRLKAREMLPQEDSEPIDEGEEIISKEQLIAKLMEYKKYKEAATSLRVYESEQYGSFSRGKPEEVDPRIMEEETSFGDINVFDLISAFQNILERAKQESGDFPGTIQPENIKLDDRIEHILGIVEEEEVAFETLFMDDMRRLVLIVTFMAFLELVKMGKICFRQEEKHGKIFIKKRAENLPLQ